MSDRRIAAGLLLGLALVGCRAPSPRSDRVELPGCYVLFTSDGRTVSDFYNASPRVRLVAESVGGSTGLGGERRMIRLNATGRRVDESSRASSFPPSWSYDPATDSLALSFRNGYSGATLSLYAPPGPRDTLHGTIQENWDFGEPTSDLTTAYAVRIRCPIVAF